MDQQDTLADFLLDNNLGSLLQPLTDQEADLDFLLQANDHELSLLVPGVVNKGKLRLALARYKELMLQEKPVHVTPPFRAGHLTSDSDLSTWTLETSETNLVDPGSNCSPGLPTTVDTAPPAAESSSTSRKPDTFLSPVIVSNASSGFNSPGITVIDTGCAEWEIADEIITSVDFFNTGSASLKTILENTSAGKLILSRTFLTTKDRKILTAIIVEAEIRKLKKISDPIRKEVWENWTTEIITLFPGETKAVYYSPFRILDGRVLQASGLIVNRLITVRRRLVPAENRRSRSRSSDDSSDSSTKKKARTSTEPVRVRPLPESFNSKKIGDQEESGESYLQWLKASSSPRDLVNSKWKNCLRGRIDILKESDHITYFKEFPALQCPWGYELLASDFDEIYPNTKEKFKEKFPILKGRLLALLDEKSQQLTRADISIQSVLELGTLGEEQANVAAFLSIPLLLKQMHTIPVKGTRKPWNPSRAEVSSAFLSLVASSSDVETHRLERQAKLIDKKEEDSAATEMCYKCCDSCKITLSFLMRDDIYEQPVNLMSSKLPHEKAQQKDKGFMVRPGVDSWAPYDFSRFDNYLNKFKDDTAEHNRIKRRAKRRRGRGGRRRGRQRVSTSSPDENEAAKNSSSTELPTTARRNENWESQQNKRKKKKDKKNPKSQYETYDTPSRDWESTYVEMPKDLYQAHLRPGVIFRIHMSEAILKMQYRNYGEDKDESVIEADVEYLRLTRKVINDEITKFEDLKWLVGWFNNRSSLIQEHMCNTRYYAVGTPPTMFTHPEEYMKRMCLFDNVYIDHIPFVVGEDSSLMAAVAPPVLHCDAATCTSVPFIDSVMFDERLARTNVRTVTRCQASCRAHCRNDADCLKRCSDRCLRAD